MAPLPVIKFYQKIFFDLGVQCGVAEAIRNIQNTTLVEHNSDRIHVNARNERVVTTGRNRQIMAPARRPSSGFPTDVRETDRLSRSGAGLC